MLSVNGLLLQVDKSNVGKVVSRIQMAVTTTIDNVDLKRTCRICLMKYDPEKLFCLFGANNVFQDLSIASAVFDCFGIELKQDKELPSFVCIKCATTTLQSYTFKKCLVKCQGFLKKQQLGSAIDAVQPQRSVADNSEKEGNTEDFQGILYNYLNQKMDAKEEGYENKILTDTDNSSGLLCIEKNDKDNSNSLSSLNALADHTYIKELKVDEEMKVNSKPADDIHELTSNNDSCNMDQPKPLQSTNETGEQRIAILRSKKKAVRKICTSKSKASVNIRNNTNTGDRWWLKGLGPPYECRICGRKYGTNFRPFYMHVRAHRILRLPCTYCGKRFIRDKLVVHLRSHTKERPFQCDQCPAQFTIEGNLKRHLRCHTGEKLYVCDICGKAYTQSTSLHSHKQRHVGQTRYVCVYCGKTFTSDSSHRSHLYNSHSQGKFIRATKFGEESNDQHQTSTYKCEICGRGFKTMMALCIHTRAHSQRKTFNCAVCSNKRFSLLINYQVHMFWHQVQMWEPSDIVPITCKFCDQVFSNKRELLQHLQTHMERPFSCSHCDKTFFTKIALSHHSRQHNDERPFGCTACEKTFRYAATLKQHQKIHTGEKPYKCDICSRSFAQQQQLASHTLTHTGEKKYICPFCDKAFALNGNLTVHKRRHTGETPFLCDICGKGFYDSSTMKKHKQGQHKNMNLHKVTKRTSSEATKEEINI